MQSPAEGVTLRFGFKTQNSVYYFEPTNQTMGK